jgi:hypothetical protein
MFESAYQALSPRGVIAAALIAPPSAELIAALTSIEVGGLDAGLQVDLMVAWERVTAWVQAQQLPVVAVVGDVALADAQARMGPWASTHLPFRASHAEIGCALRLPEREGERRLSMAQMLGENLPAVQTALLCGDISYEHAVAIAETAEEIPDPADRVWVAAKVLPKARHQTVSQLRRCLRRLLLAVNPKTASERHRQAVAERDVYWSPLPDGMAELRLTATGSDIKAVFNTVDAAARSMPKKDPDGRHIPIAARRADAMVAMIAGGSGGAMAPGVAGPGMASTGKALRRLPASIQVTVDLPTLLGLLENPAELVGYGPIPAELARSLAADGKWRRLICDPLTGALIDLGTTVYTPNGELERFIRSRDPRCIFPNCWQPAHRCEIDHTKPYDPDNPQAGTDRCNLGCLCEFHHDLKHLTGWHLARDPFDHTGNWTSPTGHHYPAPHHDHRTTAARDGTALDRPDDPVAPPAGGHVEIRWTDWHYLLPDENDGQSDWDSFVQDHLTPPDPTDMEPAYETHEVYDFGDDSIGNDDELRLVAVG